MIVKTPNPVSLVGGAKVRPKDVKDALRLAPRLVAADGGADRLLALGAEPEAVIGDMDSLSDDARVAFGDRLHQIEEQDSTDFDKALRHIEAPLVIALGMAGGRFDHELAAMHVLLAHPDRPCVVVGAECIVCLCPADVEIDLAAGTIVSLFPFAETRVASRGLRWATDGITFAPAGRIGTSNEAQGPVHLAADRPAMMVILPRDCLGALVRALLAVPPSGRWPAPAG